MHRFADRVVRRVVEAGGVIPLPQGFADLAELDRLAAAIERREGPRFDAVEMPVYVNGVAFHPPTLGVMAWARQVGQWWPEEPEIAELALLYGLTTAKSKEHLLLTERDAARSAVHRWARSVAVTAAQAREVLAVLLPEPRDPDEVVKLRGLRLEHGDSAAKWPEAALRAAVAAWLALQVRADRAATDDTLYKGIVYDCMREYGGTEDKWVHDTSINRLLAAADESQRLVEEEADARAAANGAGSASRWSVIAQQRFNWFARGFQAKYSPARPEPQPPPSA